MADLCVTSILTVDFEAQGEYYLQSLCRQILKFRSHEVFTELDFQSFRAGIGNADSQHGWKLSLGSDYVMIFHLCPGLNASVV